MTLGRIYHVAIRRGARSRAKRAGSRSSVGSVLTPAAFDRPSVHHLPLQLDDSHSGMLVGVELDECEATVGLHADLGEIADGLEEGNKIRLRAVGHKIADIDSGVVCGRLLDDGFIRKWPTLEVDRGRGAASPTLTGTAGHGCPLSLLVGPVDANGTRPEPFAIHGGDSLFGVGLVSEGKEPVATRLARVHVPHDTRIREGAERAERLGEDIVVDFGDEVADEDVIVVARVLLVLLALVRPVDADLGVEDLAPVEGLERSFGCAHVHVFDETIVETAVLVVAVRDDLDVLHGTGHSKDLRQHILRHPWAEVSDVEVSPSLVVVIDERIDEEGLELWHDDIE